MELSDVTAPDTKKCPYCAETIKAEAVVCRFCGRDVAPKVEPPAVASVVPHGNIGYVCSACGGFVRADAASCKNCGVTFGAPTAAGPASGAPAAAAPAKKGPSGALVLMGVVGVLVVLALLGLIGGRGGSSNSGGGGGSSAYRVTYRVKGSAAQVSLTYTNAGGDSEQRDAIVPWETSFQARDGQFLYVSAQNKGERGTVTCEVVLNGTVVKTSTSEGAYKIASCSGRI